MCGICAIVHLDQRPATPEVLDAMNTAAHNRGPDGNGVLCRGPVGMGHNRLSIIDVSSRSAQPMVRQGALLTYNGEIYNYLELREALEAKGHVFSTTSDTEVLLIALLEWGKQALDRLCGMFAFVYYNEAKGEIWAVRDRFGIKPLVFTRTGNTLLFASEAKQILASGMVSACLNESTATAFLAYASLNTGANTFFDGIEEIQAGDMATISLASGSFQTSTWYQLSDRINPSKITYNDAVDAVRDRMLTSIARHHRSDVPLASCLSGGIDSSAIVTLSRSLFPQKDLTTISTFAPYEGYDETRFSRAVATASAAHPIEIEADTQRVWDPELLEELCYIQDQPIRSGSYYNEYLVFKAARENGFTVMLDGQGSDEYFGGYGSFWFASQCDLLRSGRLIAFVDGLRANAETMQRSMRTEIINFTLALRRARQSRTATTDPWIRGTSLTAPVIETSFLPLSLEQITQTSIPFQLHSEDRNSMHWSIESRVPFLDHELVECVINLPTNYKVGNGYRKRILRDAIPELPDLIAQRKDKIGFASPDFIALKQRTHEVRSALETAARNLPNLVDEPALLDAFDRMASGRAPYDRAFFRVLALDSWRRAHRVSV